MPPSLSTLPETGAKLPCPSCKRSFGALQAVEGRQVSCRYCLEDFEIVPFAALNRERSVSKPQAVLLAEDSTCFFHGSNQADAVCDGCGRFLCAVCAVPFTGGTFCPSCIAAQKQADTALPGRMLYGSLALCLAVLPLLMWPLTVFAAPLTLGLVIYGWNKPGSLVAGRRRWLLLLSGLIALAQLAGWSYGLLKLLA